MKHFDFEEERIKNEIQKHAAKKVLLQLPEGLKPDAPRLARLVEKSGALPIISANPCYGACDLAIDEAETLGADLIIHFGHSRLMKYERTPTIYVEARATLNVEDTISKALPLLKEYKKIGLTTTIQHIQTLDQIREQLLRADKTIIIGDAGKLNYAGQVIGCDYSNAKSISKDVEAFLFVGGGQFHALGVALSTAKPTIVADPYDCKAFRIDAEAEKILKRRWACIQLAQKAKLFGVLIGLKPGQKRLEQALQIRKELDNRGFSSILFAVNEVAPELFMEFPSIDAYVNTACPRLSLDDASRFGKPVISFGEALVVIGELSWEELCKRGLLEN